MSEQPQKQFGLAGMSKEDREQMKLEKWERLKDILEYARTHVYTSQSDIVAWLCERGHSSNQGGLSRDLNALGIAPYVDKHGVKRLGRRSKILSEQLEERYVKVFQEAVTHADLLDTIVVLDTLPGCAQAVATIIESAGWNEVLSIYYGMSSVTLMCFNDETASQVLDRIKEGIL